MRFPLTLPVRTIAQVVMALRTIFWAFPALRRVEPATTSGPVSVKTAMSAMRAIRQSRFELSEIVRHPASRAASSAPAT